MGENVVTITKDNFENEVLKSDVPVLVGFLGGLVRAVQDGVAAH